jgi:hypothetical protein
LVACFAPLTPPREDGRAATLSHKGRGYGARGAFPGTNCNAPGRNHHQRGADSSDLIEQIAATPRRFACADLIDREGEPGPKLRNDHLLSAIWHLSTFEDSDGRRRKSGVRRRVNFAGLDVEELGSIYESLLDYHPEVTIDGERSKFELIAGTERKSTGSYYTPPELVRELIKSALEPVIEERLAKATTRDDKERALLSMKLCDPASGSGHFMLAAARRLGRELARVRSGEAEPNPADYRHAVRDVIRRCVYAVDRNPLAVDLCKRCGSKATSRACRSRSWITTSSAATASSACSISMCCAKASPTTRTSL